MSSKANSTLKHRVSTSKTVTSDKVPEEKRRRKHGGVTDIR